MAKFCVSLSDYYIADQIANLINTYNRLYKLHTTESIMSSNTTYLVEILGTEVVGCVGITTESYEISRIHHISVKPEVRKRGIAKKLTCLAITQCQTTNVYMTIRADNYASLALAIELEFIFVNSYWNRDHYVITAARRLK